MDITKEFLENEVKAARQQEAQALENLLAIRGGLRVLEQLVTLLDKEPLSEVVIEDGAEEVQDWDEAGV